MRGVRFPLAATCGLLFRYPRLSLVWRILRSRWRSSCYFVALPLALDDSRIWRDRPETHQGSIPGAVASLRTHRSQARRREATGASVRGALAARRRVLGGEEARGVRAMGCRWWRRRRWWRRQQQAYSTPYATCQHSSYSSCCTGVMAWTSVHGLGANMRAR
jgi:hypothetical protein